MTLSDRQIIELDYQLFLQQQQLMLFDHYEPCRTILWLTHQWRQLETIPLCKGTVEGCIAGCQNHKWVSPTLARHLWSSMYKKLRLNVVELREESQCSLLALQIKARTANKDTKNNWCDLLTLQIRLVRWMINNRCDLLTLQTANIMQGVTQHSQWHSYVTLVYRSTAGLAGIPWFTCKVSQGF